MSENTIVKTIKVRLINTHDTPTNWAAIESTFVPNEGEFIIYSDAAQMAPRAKIGDGVTTLDKLPFSTTPVWVGTKANYELEQGNLPIGTIVYITDDSEVVADATDTTEGVLGEFPAASAQYRGRTIIINKNGNDQPFICLYRGGVYRWHPYSIGSGVEGGVQPESGATTAVLGTAKLGSMILGQE